MLEGLVEVGVRNADNDARGSVRLTRELLELAVVDREVGPVVVRKPAQ